MAKIKINKLPKGFKLEGNKVVEDNIMRDGGDLRTGDQADYGLVTTPQEYFGGTTFNNTDDNSVRYSLSGVPRENANIEAEGGETVLTDLNDDGTFGLYNIKGPRHSQGGVPMFLPEQSFIFSDTPKMKFGKEEMAEFGLKGSKKTPANISKRFELNDYYGELDSEYADNISSRSAELMLKKNMEDLSKLSFMQEAKKGFESGVPLASHPFLMMQGIDPIEFTAQAEEISEEKAKADMIAQLSPEEQQQLMMMEQMMAQQQSQQPQEGTMPMAQFGGQNFGNLSNFIKQAQQTQQTQKPTGIKTNNNGLEYPNPYKEGTPNSLKFEQLRAEGYKFEVKDGKLRYYKDSSSSLSGRDTNQERQTIQLQGSGKTSPIYSDNLKQTGDVINKSDIGYYDYGKYSGGNLPQVQNSTGDQWYGSNEFESPEARADFMRRHSKLLKKIPDFEYDKGKDNEQWGKFQKLYEEERKKFATKLGIDYVPYFGDGTAGAGFDSKAGAKVFNAPGFDIDYQKGSEGLLDLPAIEKEVKEVAELREYERPNPEYWKQDLVNIQAMNAIDDELFLPFNQQLERVGVDYVLDDYTAAVNANLGAQNTMVQALGNFGPQAIVGSNVFGKTLDANAKAIAQKQSQQVATMNRAGAMDAQMQAQQNLQQAKMNGEFYDNVQLSQQNAQNFDNWKIMKNAELYNGAITNRANTANMNSLYNNFDINATNAGIVEFTDTGNQLYKDTSGDADANFAKQLTKYERLSGNVADEKMKEWFWKSTHGGVSNQPAGRNNAQVEMQNMPPQGYQQQGKKGKEMKKWAGNPFFYSGKMGV